MAPGLFGVWFDLGYCDSTNAGRALGISCHWLLADDFWSLVESSRERARGYAQRIRTGDIKHDPKGDGCPTWCDLWTMCRVERP